MAVTLEELAAGQCKSLPPGTPAVDPARAAALLDVLPGWSRDGDAIAKTYAFDDHYDAVAFANAIAWISHRQDHHPDLAVGFNKVTVRYSTHSVGGLSDNDFVCAARVERLLA